MFDTVLPSVIGEANGHLLEIFGRPNWNCNFGVFGYGDLSCIIPDNEVVYVFLKFAYT